MLLLMVVFSSSMMQRFTSLNACHTGSATPWTQAALFTHLSARVDEEFRHEVHVMQQWEK